MKPINYDFAKRSFLTGQGYIYIPFVTKRDGNENGSIFIGKTSLKNVLNSELLSHSVITRV